MCRFGTSFPRLANKIAQKINFVTPSRLEGEDWVGAFIKAYLQGPMRLPFIVLFIFIVSPLVFTLVSTTPSMVLPV